MLFFKRVLIYMFKYYRDCFFTTNSVHKKSDFIDQINESGGGGLTLSLRDSELTDFYHFLCKGFDFEDDNNRKLGASFIGLQQDNTWILSGVTIHWTGLLDSNLTFAMANNASAKPWLRPFSAGLCTHAHIL